jgi:hypothetical protein
MNKVSVYAAGGTGINLTKLLPIGLFSENAGQGVAMFDGLLIDTSKSNFKNINAVFNTFRIEEDEDGGKVSGSGKERKLNLKATRAEVRNMLLELHPSDTMNIIVTGLGGGTGGTVSHVLAGEILKRDKPLIIIAVGSLACGKEIENTLNSLLSFEALAVNLDKPVVMYYLENSEAYSRNDVDNELVEAMNLLAILCSGENDELDDRDVANLINYHRVTKHQPMLVSLDIHNAAIPRATGTKNSRGHNADVLAAATLISDTGQDSTVRDGDKPVQYQATGIIPQSCSDGIHKLSPIHYTIIDGPILGAIDNLQKIIKATEDDLAVRQPRRKVLANVVTDDDGFLG